MSIKNLLLFIIIISTLNYIFKPENNIQNLDNIDNIDSIIKIKCSIDNEHKSVGTGFYIDKTHIMTSYHVVTNDCMDANSKVPLTIKYLSSYDDVAILYTPHHIDNYFALSCDSIQLNSKYEAFGFEYGKKFIQSSLSPNGNITSPYSKIEDQLSGGLILMDGYLAEGMSGGPVINENGEVVAINTATSDDHKTAGIRSIKDTISCE